MSRFMEVYEWSLFGSSTQIDYTLTDTAIKDIYSQLRKKMAPLAKYKKGLLWGDDPKISSNIRTLLDHKFHDSSVTEMILVDFKLYKYDSKLNDEAMQGYSDNDKVGRVINDVIRHMKEISIKISNSIEDKYPFISKVSWDMYPDDGEGVSVFIYCNFDPSKASGGDSNE